MQPKSLAMSAAALRKSSRKKAMEKQYTLMLYVSMLFVFVHSLIENTGISINIPSIVSRIMMLGGFCTCFLLMNRKDIKAALRKTPYAYVLMAFFGFCVLMTVSSFVNSGRFPILNPVTYNLLFLLFLLEGICLVIYATATGRIVQVFDFWYHCVLVFVLLNDALMFSGVIRFSDGQFQTYLVGTKFDVVYSHMNLMAFFFTRMKLLRPGKKNAKLPPAMLFVFLLLNVIISIYVDCNTGMLGSLLVVGMILYFDKREKQLRRLMASVKTFVILSLVSMLFAYYIFWLIEQPLVQYIVVDKLGRSLTLTGRTEIYELYPSVMSGEWLWGYGIGNAYTVCWPAFGYTDVQNAILQWVLEVGFPSVILMLIFFCTIIALCKRKRAISVIMPILALVYTYLLLGTVEITLNRNFFMLMICLMLLSGADQLPNKRLGIAGSAQEQQSLQQSGEQAV